MQDTYSINWMRVIIVVIILLFILVFSVWLFLGKLKKKNALRLALRHGKIPEIVKQLDPMTFEIWAQGLFINYGADAVLSHKEKKTGFDHGIDLVANYKGQKICVQCKKYFLNNLVNEVQVREFYGAKAGGGYNKAVYITTSKFTERAINWALEKKDYFLINGDLLQKIRDGDRCLINFLNKDL